MAFPGYTKIMHNDSYPEIEPTNPALSAKGKVVVVTGGGVGVGKGIARGFIQAGAKAVAILGRREKVLLEAKKSLEAEGSSKVLYFVADVLDEQALLKAYAEVEAQVGPVDVTIANAGYMSSPGNAIDSDVDDWWKTFEINIKGTLLTFKAFMKHKGDKTPVFISMNTAGAHVPPLAELSSYGASKTGAASLIGFLQLEHPSVRVVSMHPGVIETEMYTKSNLDLPSDSPALPASFAVWLASPEAAWTGGRLLWAAWDVNELKSQKDRIIEADDLTIRLQGWPKEHNHDE